MSGQPIKLEAGQQFEGKYPFIFEPYEYFDGDGMSRTKTWRPGARAEMIGPEDSGMVADGEGEIILTIVSIHKPGRYPERVFYLRRWRDPSGREFGRGKLWMASSDKFRRLARGYLYDYEIVPIRRETAA